MKSTPRKKTKRQPMPITVASMMRKHFRIDLQIALLDRIRESCEVTHQSGIQAGYACQTFTFSMLSLDRQDAPADRFEQSEHFQNMKPPFLLTILCALLASAVQIFAAEKPNVLFILCDDLRPQALGCYPDFADSWINRRTLL